MQSNDDSTHTEILPNGAVPMKRLLVGTDEQGNLTLEVDGHLTTIRDMRTTDKELYDALQYEPFARYEIEAGPHDGVRDEVFDEFMSLMTQIAKLINEIDRPSA